MAQLAEATSSWGFSSTLNLCIGWRRLVTSRRTSKTPDYIS